MSSEPRYTEPEPCFTELLILAGRPTQRGAGGREHHGGAAGSLLPLVPPEALPGAPFPKILPKTTSKGLLFPFLSQKRAFFFFFCPGKPPRLRRRLVRDVYFCISSCARVFCVSAAPGCCESPFQQPARTCPRISGGVRQQPEQNNSLAVPSPVQSTALVSAFGTIRGIKGGCSRRGWVFGRAQLLR